MRLKVCFDMWVSAYVVFYIIHTSGYYYNFNMISDSTSFWYFTFYLPGFFLFFLFLGEVKSNGYMLLGFTFFLTVMGLWNVGVECVNSIYEEECGLFLLYHEKVFEHERIEDLTT
jgi:hypothetical protein